MPITLTSFFGLLGGLLVLAYLANRFAHRTNVPDVVVLLGCGIVVGPVLHWLNAAAFPEVTRGVGTLALILILFAAGLELDFRRARKQFAAGTVLALLSYGLTMGGVSLFCVRVLGMGMMDALLAGGTLACMSGSIVLPVLEQMELRRELKTTLVIEASFGDGIGALVVGALVSLVAGGATSQTSGGEILSKMVEQFFFRFGLGFVIAFAAGLLWARLLPKISNKRFWQVLTFATVLIVYSGTGSLGGSELFAVMVFGAVLATLLGAERFLYEFEVQPGAKDEGSQIHVFHSELAFLVRSFFFVLLGAMIQFQGLKEQLIPSVGLVVVMLAARFAAVQMSRVVWRRTSGRERDLATTLIPRGLITAVLALEAIRAKPAELVFLPSLTFAVILLTNGLALVAMVRSKGVTAPEAGSMH
ncbi:MAG: cation:proton antiporter [Acidobacteriota bacterium]|nr:cation:proton antiporter [Acidobacteriota bacterium]